jgi:hypothetical protein
VAGKRTGAETGTLRVRVICTDLPGTCFRDPQDPARPVKLK